MSRNIVIFPNRDTTVGGSEPTITFSGASAGTITLKVEDDGSIVYEGDTGALFSIEDNKDGLIHSVNDVSGLPIFQVWDENMVKMGKWNSNTLIVSGNSWNVLVGDSHTISDETSLYSSIIGGTGHTINPSVINTVIVGGVDVTGTSSNTVYVPQLNISTLGTGTSVNTIGIDSDGMVVSAATSGGGSSGAFTSTTANNTIIPTNSTGNTNTSNFSSILGGINNNLSGATYSTIGGGGNNLVSGNYSTIGGGKDNIVSGSNSFIGSGYNNRASGYRSSVLGGYNNTASGDESIAGGYNSTASGKYGLAFGYNANATSPYDAIALGHSVTASGYNSFAAGLRTEASGKLSFVFGQGGGSGNTLKASGDYSKNFSNVLNGTSNVAAEFSGIFAGRDSNIDAGAVRSFIGGGALNQINSGGLDSVIIGGTSNGVTAQRSVVIGGTGITGTTADAVYVPKLNIGTVLTTTPSYNLGIDVNGFVTSGTTGGGGGGTTKYAANVPMTGATVETVTHSLGTTDIIVQIKDSTGSLIIPDVVDNYTTNTVDITVSSTETYRVIIIG